MSIWSKDPCILIIFGLSLGLSLCTGFLYCPKEYLTFSLVSAFIAAISLVSAFIAAISLVSAFIAAINYCVSLQGSASVNPPCGFKGCERGPQSSDRSMLQRGLYLERVCLRMRVHLFVSVIRISVRTCLPEGQNLVIK